jgi:DNA ligase-1
MDNKSNVCLSKVLDYTLNPFKTYGITPFLVDRDCTDGFEFDLLTWDLLDRLIERSLTGNAAKVAIETEMLRLSADSASLFFKILAKDLRCGVNASTINKVFPDLIPVFPYQRCSLPKDVKLDKWNWVGGIHSQQKCDGMYINLTIVSSTNFSIASRSGTPFPISAFSALDDVVSNLDAAYLGFQYQGEMLVYKGGSLEPLPREIGNGILNSVQQGGSFADDEYPSFVIWDRIAVSAVKAKGQDKTPYRERFAAVSALVNDVVSQSSDALDVEGYWPIQLVETKIVYSMAEAYAHYSQMLAAGREGTIIKESDGIWKDGTSKQQVKLKLTVDCDLKIVGFTPGSGKHQSTFGSITCRTCDDLLEVNVSGFADAKRLDIHNNRESLIGTIMAVQFNDIMKPTESNPVYSLFLPRHLELRTDKTEADTLQRVIDQLESAKEA